MKLITSRNVHHDLTPIRFAYRFAQHRARTWGKKLNGVTVQVTHTDCCRGYCGRAWKRRQAILLRLAHQLPAHLHQYPLFQNMPTCWIWGGPESIVYIAAHEFGHLIGWGSGRDAEVAACRFGYEAVQAWRDRQYQHPACLI